MSGEWQQQYRVGEVVNGHSWTGTEWVPVTSQQLPASRAYAAPQLSAPSVSPARSAAGLFWLGVFVAVGVSAAGLAVVNSSGGGIIWYGGYFVTLAVWRRAWRAYRSASAASGQQMSSSAMLAVAAGVIVAVGSAAVFGVQWINAESHRDSSALATVVGSCWSEDGSQVYVVDCGDSSAKYRAVDEVSTGQESSCPEETVGTVVGTIPAQTLCLAPK